MMSTNERRENRRICEWASLTGERLPDEYGPCGPDTET
jgi:hypothetical protein